MKYKLIFFIVFLISLFSMTVLAIDLTDCGTLSSIDTIYNLQNDVTSSGTCFTISANNITLDCNNYLIKGSNTGNGIFSNGFSNLTIKNCKVRMYLRGLYILTSSNLNIVNNTIWNNTGMAGRFIWVNNSFFINNTINDTRGVNAVGGFGFQLQVSNNNTVSYNNVFGNSEHGIQTTTGSLNNTITYNNVSFNDDAGIVIEGQNNLIAHNFLINNKEGAIYSMFNTNLGNNNTYDKIINNTIIGTMDGPGPASPEGHGIALYGNNYEITNNTIINSTRNGIYLFEGNSSIISGNIIANHTNNSYGAIYLSNNPEFQNINNVIIKDNILINNTNGIFLNSTLNIYSSLYNNNITYSLNGIYVNNAQYINIINNTFNETGNMTSIQEYFPLTIINSSYLNINSNKFYNQNQTISNIFFSNDSVNNFVWMNYFYNDGIYDPTQNNSYCVSNLGNHYHYRYNNPIFDNKTHVGWNDCGSFDLMIKYGDADTDDVISPTDASIMQQIIIGINPNNILNAYCKKWQCKNLDIDNDTFISPADYSKEKLFILGLQKPKIYVIS